MNIVKDLTKNFTPGWNGEKPTAVVLHITEGNFAGALDWLKSPQSNASAHYLVGEEIYQLVDEKNRAWHAGRVVNPKWKGIKTSALGSNETLKDTVYEDFQKDGEKGSEYIILGAGGTVLNPNNYTLSIEVALNSAYSVPTWKQWKNAAWLVRDMCQRYGWTINDMQVVHHNEIRADKTCPGMFVTRFYMNALSKFL